MKVLVHRDQAVWERETFEVEIPDNTPEAEREEAVDEAIDNFDGYGEDGYDISVIDGAVEGLSTEIEVSFNNGENWVPA